MPDGLEKGGRKARRKAQVRRALSLGFSNVQAHASALVNRAFHNRNTPEAAAAQSARLFRRQPGNFLNRQFFIRDLRQRGFGRWRARAQWNVLERQRRQRWMLNERRLGIPFRPRAMPGYPKPDDLPTLSDYISKYPNRRPPPSGGGGVSFEHDEL